MPAECGRCVLSLLRICIEEIKQSSVFPAIASSAMNKSQESTVRFGDVIEICAIAEGAHYSYSRAEGGHSTHATFQ